MRTELPLHDALFHGLVIRDKCCTLFFSRTDGSEYEVQLEGVEALHMDDFREGNIVFSFSTITREPPNNRINLERLYTSPHPSAAPEYHEKYAASRDRKIGAIVAGDLTLVEMEQVIGAGLLATCQRVILITLSCVN